MLYSLPNFSQLETSVSEPAKETSVDASRAMGSGYGESKWVGEKILEAAASETGLTTIVVRVGQISGGRNGYWHQKEWFPSLVRSSLFLRVFPGGDQVCSLFTIRLNTSLICCSLSPLLGFLQIWL